MKSKNNSFSVIDPASKRDVPGPNATPFPGGTLVNLRALPALVLLPLTLVAAKGSGCGAEYQGGDGSTATWSLGNVPTAKGADLPMTCEWLEGQNCWKEMIAEAAECAPKDVGTINADRSACEFEGRAALELAGPLSTPAEGSTLVEVTDHRIADAAGTRVSQPKSWALAGAPT